MTTQPSLPTTRVCARRTRASAAAACSRTCCRKAFHAELAGETLDRAYEDISEEALARQHLARKRLKQPTNDKEAARVMRQLTRAGFSPGVIFKILKNWSVSEELLESLQDAD